MPQVTTADVRLVAAWIATPSCKQAARARTSDSLILVALIAFGSRKEAAYWLGMTLPAFAARLQRLYRRFDVHSARELLLVLPDRRSA